MPLKVLTRENLIQVAKETGHTEGYLRNLLQQAAAKNKPVWVQVPLPKHLR